jgi:hypothetical protein
MEWLLVQEKKQTLGAFNQKENYSENFNSKFSIKISIFLVKTTFLMKYFF